MPLDIFGFSIGKKQPPSVESKEKSFVAPDNHDGTFTVESGGVFGTVVDFSGSIRDENQLINQYRTMALFPEVDQAIEDIVNEAIVSDIQRKPVRLDLEHIDISDNIKSKIYSEFQGILRLLDFGNKGSDIFRRWYIDSKLYYHIIINSEEPRKGIQELRSIDPVNIKKIRKVDKEQKHVGVNKVPFVKKIEEFYIYTDTSKDSVNPTSSSGIKIAPDSICYCHSGVLDSKTKRVVGYLAKAIRPTNMLRQIEDAVVIYRISRAPERRIFYIDVGNLPKQKAEQYLRDIMNRYRNKLTYNASTGEIADGKDHLHMLEDFWLPRREGGKGTEITTLDGGQNLGEMEDVNYLLKKVYRSLNVPVSRMESESGFNLGRSAEISRDEVKFFKFIEKTRNRFCDVFSQLLRVQLILKGIIKQEDWDGFYREFRYIFNEDSYFTELKQTEVMKERLDILSQLDEYIGRYYSADWVRKNVLRQTEEEIRELDTQMNKEKALEPQEEETGDF